MKAKSWLAGLIAVLTWGGLAAEEIEIRPAESILAIVTHKGGFAASQAHNHLVTAGGYRAKLDFDAASPLETRFELDFATADLAVDRWDLEQAWYPRLKQLGILDQAFSEVADKDRRKIRKSMLGDDQLDAAKFPRISARVTAVEEQAATHGKVTFPFLAQLTLMVHGKSVEKPVAVRFHSADGVLSVEAVGTFRFSDFGIEPFSAFFGAVRNEDEFHVYLNLKATVAP